MPPRRSQPSDFELQILGVLWQRGPQTARQVLEHLPDRKQRAYTSVLSVMQVMEKKGLLSHTAAGKANVYAPRARRPAVLADVFGKLVRNVFGGSRAAAVQYLLTDAPLSADDVAEIRRTLDEQSRR